MAQAQKLDEAWALHDAIDSILNLHRVDFAAAVPAVAPPPETVDASVVQRRHEAEQLAGIGLFKRSQRAAARDRAAELAAAEVRAEEQRRAHEHEELQRQLDEVWRRLLDNDPEVVIATLENAFEDNDARAAVLHVEGEEIGLLVLAPLPDAVPERMPASTPAGNLTLKKITKADRAGLYKLMVYGHVLATVREALAVAPGIQSVRIVALRQSGLDAYGKPRIEVILAVHFQRSSLQGVQWDRADADEVIRDASSEVVLNVKGQAKELQPIDLSKEPELATLLDHVDVEDLVG